MFPDIDVQPENCLIAVRALFRGSWGPRMESIQRADLETLYAVNKLRPPEQQTTILDVNSVLTDPGLRARLLREANEDRLCTIWKQTYEFLGSNLQRQTASAVVNKYARFGLDPTLRAVFGRPRSSFDLDGLVRDGGVLVVNTAANLLGLDTAMLLGAMIINMLAPSITRQAGLPAEQRTRVVMLIDEAATLSALRYETLLSELPKYGGTFHLIAQSLSQLDRMSWEPQASLVDNIFSNVDALTVFRTGAGDAGRLAAELGGTVSAASITALDDFTAVARWQERGGVTTPFTFRVEPPPDGVSLLRSQRRPGLRGRPL